MENAHVIPSEVLAAMMSDRPELLSGFAEAVRAGVRVLDPASTAGIVDVLADVLTKQHQMRMALQECALIAAGLEQTGKRATFIAERVSRTSRELLKVAIQMRPSDESSD